MHAWGLLLACSSLGSPGQEDSRCSDAVLLKRQVLSLKPGTANKAFPGNARVALDRGARKCSPRANVTHARLFPTILNQKAFLRGGGGVYVFKPHLSRNFTRTPSCIHPHLEVYFQGWRAGSVRNKHPAPQPQT